MYCLFLSRLSTTKTTLLNINVVWRKSRFLLYQSILLSCIHPLVISHLLCILIRLVFAWCIGNICARAVAPDIKQCSYFLSPKKKKKGGKRCLKSLLLNSYKSALAVVLQHNLCKAMALLSQNRFAVVGWFSDEEQLSSIRHVFFFFLSDQSPPPHRTCPAPLEAFGNLCIERLKPLQALHDCIIWY